ncbi:MAG TPA: nucleoside transporter C-terminal domain-containing protein [Acidobacteriota bacterium]|nr:nucleoside transporter C-terminal domain-containing protein [Acidobacteriota bacterium]
MIGIIGLVVLYGIAYGLSRNRAAVNARTVLWGLGLQMAFAVIIIKTTPGQAVFAALAAGVTRLLTFADAGSEFVFGSLAHSDQAGFILAFQVLPVVVFIASFFSVLYFIGLMQRVVLLMARGMHRTMKVSGSESLAAAANVFMGQTEAPIIIAPFISSMTTSELMALMTGGFATVSGAVLAAYIGLGVRADYLLSASVMAAPASLIMAKLLFPETETSKTAGAVDVDVDAADANILDAAARGASQGVTLALNIAGMLIAFLGLITLVNGALGLAGSAFANASGVVRLSVAMLGLLVAYVLLWKPPYERVLRVGGAMAGLLVLGWAIFFIRGPGELPLRLESLLGMVFAPLAWVMGIPWAEASLVGELFGTKLVLTEIVGFQRMVEMTQAGLLSPKSELIASYALCGFANFASIAIQIGGIGGLAPSRKSELARIGPWAMFAGMMSSLSTATLAGMLSGL